MRRFTGEPKPLFSLDLHVLGTPPAFVLSQDQTLQLKVGIRRLPAGSLSNRSKSLDRARASTGASSLRKRSLSQGWHALFSFQRTSLGQTWILGIPFEPVKTFLVRFRSAFVRANGGIIARRTDRSRFSANKHKKLQNNDNKGLKLGSGGPRALKCQTV